MLQLIYRSAARIRFSQGQLADLLTQARIANTAKGMTGMLLYDDGSFLQVLEGEQEPLVTLYTRILVDPRHTGVAKLLERQIDERQFGDWQMGFVSLSGLAATIPGYSEFLRSSDATASNGNQALKVLSQFREGRFRSHVEA